MSKVMISVEEVKDLTESYPNRAQDTTCNNP
jgi:hypothetical protein